MTYPLLASGLCNESPTPCALAIPALWGIDGLLGGAIGLFADGLAVNGPVVFERPAAASTPRLSPLIDPGAKSASLRISLGLLVRPVGVLSSRVGNTTADRADA